MDKQPPSSNQPSKYFDIVPGNNAAPSPSSRPILVSNHPEQSDPMMTQPIEISQPDSVTEAESSSSNEPVEPAEEPIIEQHGAETTSSELQDTPTIGAEEEAVTPESAITSATSTETVVPEVSSYSEEALPVNEALPALPMSEAPVNSKEDMVVVHHKNNHSKTLNIVTVVIIIVLVVILVDLIFDLGIIKSSSLPHTHFFGS